jgi:hypothetical protein
LKEVTKKKMAIGALSVVIVASLGFSVYTSLHINESSDGKEKTTQVAKNGEETTGKEKEKEKPVHMNPMDGKEDPALSKDKSELSLTEIKETENKVRDYFRQYKFEDGMKVLNDLDENSKFTGEAEVLERLHFDGALISNLNDHHTGNEPNGTALINMMTGFKDTETLLLATLHLDSDIRPYVIQFEGSLNPVYEEGQTPRIMNKTTEAIPHEITVMYPETKTYHKISFSLESFVLDAYILEDKNGVLRFYMIQDPHDKANYYTVSQFKKMNENKRTGRPLMEGVLELKNSSYVPTNEVLEEEIENPAEIEEEVVEQTTEKPE